MSEFIYNIKQWVFNQTFRFFPYYKLKIKSLPQQTWHETEDLIFHSAFQCLVDYIELQKPFCSYENPAYESNKRYTDVVAMREYLESNFKELSEEDLTHYGITSEEQERIVKQNYRHQYIYKLASLNLYEWFKFTYPNRIDPYDYMSDLDSITIDETTGYKIKTSRGDITIWETIEAEEDQQLIEDLQLQRLIKIRRSLWT